MYKSYKKGDMKLVKMLIRLTCSIICILASNYFCFLRRHAKNISYYIEVTENYSRLKIIIEIWKNQKSFLFLCHVIYCHSYR